ncbi:MAG: hypothetical protein U0531_12255 [Dehalococcoidia bacterium]
MFEPKQAQPPSPTVAGGAPPGRRILLSETFDNPAVGAIISGADDRALGVSGYENREFVVRKVTPEVAQSYSRRVPGSYGDAALAIDVRLAATTEGRFSILQCRRTRTGGYEAVVIPDIGGVAIGRRDGEDETVLAVLQTSAVRPGTNTNRIELACLGSEITIRINGVHVVTVEDETYHQGELAFGVGNLAPEGPAEAWFDNLVVSAPVEPAIAP